MTSEATAGKLPLFFKEPLPLQKADHGGLALRRDAGFGFAAEAHAIPLLAEEFLRAASDYPILFGEEADPLPLVAVGLTRGRNLFVDAAGKWAPGAYVPAYVRRYPFVSGRVEGREDMVLMADLGSGLLVEAAADPSAEALFQDGEPSGITTKAQEFCLAFEQQLQTTRGFMAALKAQDLLVPKEINLTLPDGSSHKIAGLLIVDEAKFNALPDGVALDWRAKGYLGAVYAHMVSLGNFNSLMHRS